ncbi:MAG: hypothetical protein PHY48_02800 [Candidatus Cloacimonetes bacterium]|nr:hypothetical protein [Candidatus Cloacimonadota bacterium]
MKKFMVLIIGFFMLATVYAQTQILPDIRVSGESDIRTYLYKRSLNLSPLVSLGDSLPSFIPSHYAVQTKHITPSHVRNNGYFQFEANAGFGLNSYFSFYPKDSWLHKISHYMDLRAPETTLISFRNHLYAGGEFIPNNPFVLRLDHTNTKANNYKGSYYESSISHHRESIDLGSIQLKEINWQLGITDIRQEVIFENFNKDYYDAYLSQQILVGSTNTNTKAICQSGEFGAQIAPLINWEPFNISHIRIHLLADAYRFIPSVEFNFKHQISDSGKLRINNTPSLDSNSFNSILEKGAWIQFSNAHKLMKTPLNLKSSLEFTYPSDVDFSLKSLIVSNLLKYEAQSPILVSGSTYGVAYVDFVDVASSESTVEAFFLIKNFGLSQELKVDLAYLPAESMHRVGYRPILSLTTHSNYSMNNWLFSLDISQNYFTIDHRGRDLSETIIGNLGVEYSLDGSTLYAELANIFNQHHWEFSEHPSRKRNIFLGLKHRF